MKRIESIPDEESVWDYPRPPALEETRKHLKVEFNDKVIADTKQAKRVLETSHPPVYYLPPGDINLDFLHERSDTSFCEWKGRAHYFNVVVEDSRAEKAAWAYAEPNLKFAAIKDHIAFYAHKMDACYVVDERVHPQEGSFYGGWITDDIVGPFKGGPCTSGW